MLTHVNIQYRVHISLNDGTDLHSFLYVCPSLPQTGSLLLEHLLNVFLLQFSINLSLCHTLRCSKIISNLSGHSTCSSSSATTGSTCFKKDLLKNSFTDHPSIVTSLCRKLCWEFANEELSLKDFVWRCFMASSK